MTQNEIGRTEATKSSISRRNALKAGVATGVGAAAFAGPQIGMLGMTPAYADTCSANWVTIASSTDCQNVSCNCPNSTVNYKEYSLAGGGATAEVTRTGSGQGSGCGSLNTTNEDGEALVSLDLTNVTGYAQCRVTFIFYVNGNSACTNGTGPTVEISSGGVATGTAGETVFPIRQCSPTGGPNLASTFFKGIIECNTDSDLLCGTA